MKRSIAPITEPLPPEMCDIASRRTAHLRHAFIYEEKPFEWLCVQAYMNGVADTAEALSAPPQKEHGDG